MGLVKQEHFQLLSGRDLRCLGINIIIKTHSEKIVQHLKHQSANNHKGHSIRKWAHQAMPDRGEI